MSALPKFDPAAAVEFFNLVTSTVTSTESASNKWVTLAQQGVECMGVTCAYLATAKGEKELRIAVWSGFPEEQRKLYQLSDDAITKDQKAARRKLDMGKLLPYMGRVRDYVARFEGDFKKCTIDPKTGKKVTKAMAEAAAAEKAKKAAEKKAKQGITADSSPWLALEMTAFNALTMVRELTPENIPKDIKADLTKAGKAARDLITALGLKLPE